MVLATDDDGIWAIHKCKRHYHHVSVAAEYCEAISNGDIQDVKDLERMLKWGRTRSFSQSQPGKKNIKKDEGEVQMESKKKRKC